MSLSDRVNLTKRVIDTIRIPESGRVEYQDANERFLRLVVSAAGRRTWRYVRKVNGKTKFITIGTYPEFTPTLARERCQYLSAEYAAGRDPSSEVKARKNKKSWGALFRWYIDNHARPHKRTWEYDLKMNERYCANWDKREIESIASDFIKQWHIKTGSEHGKHQADRVLAMVKTVFSKAISEGLLQTDNPAAKTSKFFSDAEEYGRDRRLNERELKQLLKALDELPNQDASDFFYILLFTGARKGNVLAMRWKDMDLSDPEKPMWIVPSKSSKNKRPMRINIVEPLTSILNRRYEERRSDEWVFPSRHTNSKKPHITELKKAWAKICNQAGLRDVRIHDLRRTMGSWQANLGASLHIIGKSLGHRSERTTRIYARLDDNPVRASVEAAVQAMLNAKVPKN